MCASLGACSQTWVSEVVWLELLLHARLMCQACCTLYDVLSCQAELQSNMDMLALANDPSHGVSHVKLDSCTTIALTNLSILFRCCPAGGRWRRSICLWVRNQTHERTAAERDDADRINCGRLQRGCATSTGHASGFLVQSCCTVHRISPKELAHVMMQWPACARLSDCTIHPA